MKGTSVDASMVVGASVAVPRRRGGAAAERDRPRRTRRSGTALSDRPDGARARRRRRARRDRDARSAAGARQMPADLLVSDNAHARGFRLEGYGVFFDVDRAVVRDDADVEPPDARPERSRPRQRAAHAPDPRQDRGRSEPGAGAEAGRAAGQPGALGAAARCRASPARATVTGSAASTAPRHAARRRRSDPDGSQRGVSHRSHRRR